MSSECDCIFVNLGSRRVSAHKTQTHHVWCYQRSRTAITINLDKELHIKVMEWKRRDVSRRRHVSTLLMVLASGKNAEHVLTLYFLGVSTGTPPAMSSRAMLSSLASLPIDWLLKSFSWFISLGRKLFPRQEFTMTRPVRLLMIGNFMLFSRYG